MEQEIKPKLMIMSLGGSPEPLVKSIQSYSPAKIIFFASHDSVSLSGDIFKALDFKPASEFEITENPNSIFECCKAALRAIERVKKAGITCSEVMVDYTGGTKVMTASLIMAAVGYPFQFNYVGGDLRNKGGVGIVTDGHEKMFAEMNPWSIFAEVERRQVITLFNKRNYSAVIEIINSIDRELPLQVKQYFKFIKPLAEGFLYWDQFNHAAAYRKIDEGSNLLKEYLSAFTISELEPFYKGVLERRAFLSRIIEKSKNDKYHMILVTDLLNNAKRRMESSRYDDAAARIYRALELYGQIIFKAVAGCDNDSVKPEMIPVELKDEFVRKYRDPQKGILKLPQTATFEYLKEKGHEAGKRFFEKQKEIKKIQNNRNDSILAHGTTPISENAANAIFQTVVNFVQESYFFDFPRLP
ncbi:MAG: TIGR02710 family CRISPR-associated protein [Deltaproteobacteria bacterium]|nr:TIGR02710 family CRISPR-associated protein [Deltaproteobacteria bacterium]